MSASKLIHRYLGLDLSLNSTGYCYKREDEYVTGRIRPKHLRGVARLEWIKQQVHHIATLCIPDVVSIEGIAMSPFNQQGKYDNAELHGVLKLYFWERNIKIILVPPTTLKKFIADSGKADKQEVQKGIADKYGYRITQDDEADAFALYQYALAKTNARVRRGISKEAKASMGGCSILVKKS